MPTVRIHDTAGQIEPAVVDSDDREDYTDAERDSGELAAPEPAPGVAAAASDDDAGFSAKQAEAIQRLRRLGSRRATVRAELERVEKELLGEAIGEAFAAGVAKRVIAAEAQVTRQTVYNVLARERDAGTYGEEA